jgi:hypothetical protein
VCCFCFVLADPGVCGHFFVIAIYKKVLDDDVAWFSCQGIWELQECCGEDYEADFEDGVLLDDREGAEPFTPEEVEFAEETAEDAACDAEEHEDEVVDGLVVCAVVCFEEDEFAGSGWVELFKHLGELARVDVICLDIELYYGCDERAKECFPKDFSREIRADFFVAKQHAANGSTKCHRQAT